MEEKILTLTMNPAVDKSSSINKVSPESKLRCGPPSYYPGGGGINVSRAIKRLGGGSTALHASGGRTGDLLCELLEKEEVLHHQISVPGETRQNLTVFEESTELQYRFGMPGPEFDQDQWEKCLDQMEIYLPDANCLVISGSLPAGVPADFYAKAAGRAAKYECEVVVDSSGDALEKAADAGISLIKPNISELGMLVGSKIEGEDHIGEAAKKLIDEGKAKTVVVSLGGQGAQVVTAGGSYRVRAPTVPIRSKVGAGDSMLAGIVLSMMRGESMEEAVTFGVAAGAAAVMTPGTELCRREDAELLHARMVRDGN